MLLAAGSGAYLFAVKHRAQVLDNDLASVNQAAQLDGQRIVVLQAQWALEIDPTRLNALAKQFSTLQPMKPAQLVTLAALRHVLPPPNAAPPAGVQAPALMASAASASAPAAPESGLPLPPPEAPAPAMLASAVPARTALTNATPVSALPRPARVVPKMVSHSAPHLAETRLAEDMAPPRLPVAPARRAVPLGAQYVAMKAVPPAPVTPVSVDSGSVLGMAADLAPPQPLPQSLGN